MRSATVHDQDVIRSPSGAPIGRRAPPRRVRPGDSTSEPTYDDAPDAQTDRYDDPRAPAPDAVADDWSAADKARLDAAMPRIKRALNRAVAAPAEVTKPETPAAPTMQLVEMPARAMAIEPWLLVLMVALAMVAGVGFAGMAFFLGLLIRSAG